MAVQIVCLQVNEGHAECVGLASHGVEECALDVNNDGGLVSTADVWHGVNLVERSRRGAFTSGRPETPLVEGEPFAVCSGGEISDRYPQSGARFVHVLNQLQIEVTADLGLVARSCAWHNQYCVSGVE